MMIVMAEKLPTVIVDMKERDLGNTQQEGAAKGWRAAGTRYTWTPVSPSVRRPTSQPTSLSVMGHVNLIYPRRDNSSCPFPTTLLTEDRRRSTRVDICTVTNLGSYVM